MKRKLSPTTSGQMGYNQGGIVQDYTDGCETDHVDPECDTLEDHDRRFASELDAKLKRLGLG